MYRYLMIFFIVICVLAQNYEIKFTRYRDGLSHPNATHIISTKDGLIWIGTESSLNQFDSKQYYRIGIDAGLTDDFITTLAVDNDENIWIGTEDGLNEHIRGNHHIRNFRYSENVSKSISNNFIQTIYVGLSGDVWIGTKRGLNRWVGDGFERYIAKPDLGFTLRNDDIFSLIQVDSNTLFIGTNGGGLEIMDIHNFRFSMMSAIEAKVITDMQFGSNRRIWITTENNGIYYYDLNTGSFKSLAINQLKKHLLTSIEEDSFGFLWIGTKFSGLFSYDLKNQKLKNYLFQADNIKSISSNEIHDINTDPAGNLWIATSNGVNKIHKKQHIFKHYKITQSKKTAEDNMIFPIIESQSGNIWIGTFNGGLTRFDPKTESFQFYLSGSGKNTLSTNAVQAIYEDKNGILWIGTFAGGLNRFDPKTKKFKVYLKNPSDARNVGENYILKIAGDNSDNLWIATDGGGLNRFNTKTEKFTNWHMNPDDSMSVIANTLTGVTVDSRGEVWLASRRGFSFFDQKNNQFINYSANSADTNSLSDNYVLDIFEDSKNRLWLATEGGGINLFDQNTTHFKSYREKDGLLNNATYNIIEDDQHFLWITTLKGLSRFNPETAQFYNFDERDGLQSNEFNSHALTKTREGKIIAGGINGFNIFDPNKINPDTISPKVIITDFQLTNVSRESTNLSVLQFPALDEINLTYDHNNIYVRFIALEYRVPEKIQYAYQLLGFNNAWIFTGNRNDVSFTNLAPGEYQFNVKATTSDQIWTNKITSLNIIINPPFWSTNWFRLIVIFLIALVVYFNYKRRVRYIELRNRDLNIEVQERKRLIKALETKNDEMERFTYTVSHDLKSPLITIQSFLGALNQELSEKNEAVEKYIKYISEGVEKMNYLLEDLLELSRVGRMLNPMESLSLNELAEEAIANVTGYLSDKQIKIEIDQNLGNALVDRTRIVAVFQNLIENAAKFIGDQPKPHIHIGINVDKGESIYFIADNGVGIEERFHKKIFELFERLNPDKNGTGIGLALVKRIIELHEGKIWVKSEGLNKGTTFYFTLNAIGGSDEQ